jgi:hypothetical protein
VFVCGPEIVAQAREQDIEIALVLVTGNAERPMVGLVHVFLGVGSHILSS